MATALDIIRQALDLNNAVGADQTLTADETATALLHLNWMIESWTTKNLAVYNIANQTFNTVAGQATYTMGSAGNWVTDRPVSITQDAYATYQGVDFPIVCMTQQQYNDITLKTQQQIVPSRYLYVNDYPYGRLTLWPVPMQAIPITFTINKILSGPATAATAIAFPPGYAMAFVYNLSLALAQMYGKPVDPDVKALAVSSFADVMRSNRTPAVAQFESILNQSRGGVIWQRGY